MFIRSLYLHHFRNYEEAYFEFNPKLNLFCGANAQGKTNVLEALHYCITGRSFRTCRSAELIQDGAPAFFLEIKYTKHEVEQSLRISFDGTERKITHNSTLLPSPSSLAGIIPVVTTCPDDVNLVKGSPILRRRFLDLQISQTDPLYVHHLTRYTRALKQRNRLLKAKQLMSIESWEHEMSRSAAYITRQRYRTAEELQVHCARVHNELIRDPEQLMISYHSGINSALTVEEMRNCYLDRFRANRSRELYLGHTLSGPHKDDLHFAIDNKDARFFASEGQQRSYMTTVHLAEWHRLSQAGDEKPVMMLDDVGISLDNMRCSRLLDRLADLGQVFLTSTNENLLENLSVSNRLFYIRKGLQTSKNNPCAINC